MRGALLLVSQSPEISAFRANERSEINSPVPAHFPGNAGREARCHPSNRWNLGEIQSAPRGFAGHGNAFQVDLLP